MAAGSNDLCIHQFACHGYEIIENSLTRCLCCASCLCEVRTGFVFKQDCVRYCSLLVQSFWFKFIRYIRLCYKEYQIIFPNYVVWNGSENRKPGNPRLKPLLRTIVTYSFSYCFYQKDEGAKSGEVGLATKFCSLYSTANCLSLLSRTFLSPTLPMFFFTALGKHQIIFSSCVSHNGYR